VRRASPSEVFRRLSSSRHRLVGSLAGLIFARPGRGRSAQVRPDSYRAAEDHPMGSGQATCSSGAGPIDRPNLQQHL